MKKNLPYVPKLFNFWWLSHLCQFWYAVPLYEVQKYHVTNIVVGNVPEANSWINCCKRTCIIYIITSNTCVMSVSLYKNVLFLINWFGFNLDFNMVYAIYPCSKLTNGRIQTAHVRCQIRMKIRIVCLLFIIVKSMWLGVWCITNFLWDIINNQFTSTFCYILKYDGKVWLASHFSCQMI